MTFTEPQRTQALYPTADAPNRGNGMAYTGFGLGVAGLLLGFVPILGFLVTVPALLLSRAGRKRYRTGATTDPGLGRAGIVLGWIGTAVCALMTVVVIAGAGQTPTPQPVAAAPAPAAPVLIAVPNVVGMNDLQARDTLRAAGFTNVVLGPSTGPQPGVPAGTVTTQLPGAAAPAGAGDPITLGEAAEPPAPVVVPQSAPTSEPAAPTTQAARPVVADPDLHVDRPRTAAPAAPRPLVSSGSSGGPAYYKNCDAARAAGAAPLHRGDPGYSGKLDRDGDGVACE